MTNKEALLVLIAEFEKHPADYIPTWIEIRGELEKLRLIVAAYEGGDYTEEDMATHADGVLTDIKQYLRIELRNDNLLRQTILN